MYQLRECWVQHTVQCNAYWSQCNGPNALSGGWMRVDYNTQSNTDCNAGGAESGLVQCSGSNAMHQHEGEWGLSPTHRLQCIIRRVNEGQESWEGASWDASEVQNYSEPLLAYLLVMTMIVQKCGQNICWIYTIILGRCWWLFMTSRRHSWRRWGLGRDR